MDNSLLVSLRQYRPRENRDSLENFVTEAFAWLLRNVTGTTHAVLTQLQKDMPEGAYFDLPGDLDEIEWSTQSQLDTQRPDMLASWPGVALVFEHKVWSGLTDDQIYGYRTRAEPNFPDSMVRLVAITASRHQYSTAADVCLCWSDIYETLEQCLNKEEDVLNRFHIENFLALLSHEGLQPAAPVAHEAIRNYPTAGKLPLQLEQAFTPLASRDWPIQKSYQPVAKGHRWGRIGIEFHRTDTKLNWNPGIFLGCVLDGRDHLINHRNTDSVKLQVILEFSQGLHRHYANLKSYRSLQKHLTEITDASRWTLYDHLAEPTRTNSYHPLYLETPLLDILQGTKTMAEQRDCLFEAGCEALKMMQQDGYLDALMCECEAAAG